MGSGKKIILFDFDGVIVNTFDAAFEIIKNNNPELTKADYRSHFEGNIYDAIKDNDKTYRDEVMNQFFHHYNNRLMEHSLDEPIAEIIKQLSANFLLFIISSSSNSGIRNYLHKHHLDTCFIDVFASEAGLSKVEKITSVLHNYQAQPNECLFITDTLGDIKEARKASVESIAVTWGYHPIETLQKGVPYAIVESPQELTGAIDRYFE